MSVEEYRLQYFRRTLIIGIIAHTLWGIIYPIIVPSAYDSIWIRLQVGWVALVAVIGSYFNKKIFLEIEKLTYFCIIIFTFHFFFISYKNGFSIYYSTSYLTLCAICAYIIMSRKFLTVYTILVNILAAVMAFYYMSNVPVLILWLNVITAMLLAYFFTSQKIKVYEMLEKAHEELKKSHQEIVRKSEGMKSLYDTAAKMAHDIRSPLSALEFVSSSLSSQDSKQKEIIGKSVTRINDIASDMLVQYKGITKDHVDVTFKIVDPNQQLQTLKTPPLACINDVLQNIIDEKKLEWSHKHNVAIHTNMPQELTHTKFNSSELGRIFSNILNNSIEAFDQKHSGEIKINVTQNAEWVHITFLDNGKGMSEETLKNIYNKGFTLKEKGNGLGLSSAKDTLELNNARIEIYSKINVGTQVQLQFIRETANGNIESISDRIETASDKIETVSNKIEKEA